MASVPDQDRLFTAVRIALDVHGAQVRTGTNIPYMSHLFGVASLVMEDDGSKDEAAAALLHDSIEDGGAGYVPVIRDALGEHVVAIVLECSDSVIPPGTSKAPWRSRKESYLEEIPGKMPETIRVTTADKLHNARAIVADIRSIGLDVFERFAAKRNGTLWYYGELTKTLSSHPASRPRLADELRRTVDEMRTLAG